MQALISGGLKSCFLRLLFVIIFWNISPLRIAISEPVSKIPQTCAPSICTSTHWSSWCRYWPRKCVGDGNKVSVIFPTYVCIWSSLVLAHTTWAFPWLSWAVTSKVIEAITNLALICVQKTGFSLSSFVLNQGVWCCWVVLFVWFCELSPLTYYLFFSI